MLRTFVLVLISGIVLTGAYLALNPPEVANLSLPRRRPAAHAWELALAVWLWDSGRWLADYCRLSFVAVAHWGRHNLPVLVLAGHPALGTGPS